MVLVAIIVVLVIVLLAVGVFTYMKYAENKKLLLELAMRRASADEKESQLVAKVEEVKLLKARLEESDAAGVVSENKLAAVRDELATKTNEINTLMAKLKAEMTRSTEIETQLNTQIAGLQKELATKEVQLTAARKTMYEADDYILEMYLGDDRETILKLRRLRDLMLLNLHHTRKGFCNIGGLQDRIRLFTSALKKYNNLTEAQKLQFVNTMTLLESGEQDWRAGFTKFTAVDSYGGDIRQVNVTLELPTTDSKPDLIQYYKNICNADATCKAFNSNGWLKKSLLPVSDWTRFTSDTLGFYVKTSEVDALRGQTIKQYGFATDEGYLMHRLAGACGMSKDIMNNLVTDLRSDPPHSVTSDWNSLVDSIEPLIMSSVNRFCPNGALDTKHTLAVVTQLNNLFCSDNNTAEFNALVAKPLEYVLAKTYKIFLP